jgi:hypothetical protein
MATPSLAIVENGLIARLMVGARNEAQLRALLDA